MREVAPAFLRGASIYGSGVSAGVGWAVQNMPNMPSIRERLARQFDDFWAVPEWEPEEAQPEPDRDIDELWGRLRHLQAEFPYEAPVGTRYHERARQALGVVHHSLSSGRYEVAAAELNMLEAILQTISEENRAAGR